MKLGKLFIDTKTGKRVISNSHKLCVRFEQYEFPTPSNEWELSHIYATDAFNIQVFTDYELILPDEISGIKHVTNRLEKELSENSGYNRCVNLDPGYINSARLALVSTKDFSHRIYLKDGIYAEITLVYKNRNFVKLDWTYPDYMSETAIAFFKKARDKC